MVETRKHKLHSENRAHSTISELRNAKLIALACAHSFCFTYKNTLTHELFVLFYDSPILLGLCGCMGLSS